MSLFLFEWKKAWKFILFLLRTVLTSRTHCQISNLWLNATETNTNSLILKLLNYKCLRRTITFYLAPPHHLSNVHSYHWGVSFFEPFSENFQTWIIFHTLYLPLNSYSCLLIRLQNFVSHLQFFWSTSKNYHLYFHFSPHFILIFHLYLWMLLVFQFDQQFFNEWTF